jgi:glycosyltransferase involved in cell wall biosynthesis
MTPTALVYRDVILPASETGFMRRQYIGFSRLHPLWIGRQVTPAAAAAGFDVHRLGGDGPLGAVRREMFKAIGLVPDLDLLRAHRPAVIHAQFGRGGAFALPLARALDLPLVVTFHGGDAHKDKHYQRGVPPGLFARRLPALMRQASLFVCVSEGVRSKLIARGFPAAKLVVLPIGTEIPAEIGPRPAAGPLLFVGRFVPKKGVSVLIDALQSLRMRGQEPEAVMVGDGPLLETVRRQAEGLTRLSFVGWQTQEAVAALMERAALLVVPSIRAQDGDSEGLPSVALEAMALGLPVLASDQAGLEGVVIPDETGRMVRAGDAAALAAAIGDLMANHRLRARLGQAGMALARRSCDARLQSRRLEDLLLSTLS